VLPVLERHLTAVLQPALPTHLSRPVVADAVVG
jgi:hypothetical protein